MFFCKVSTCNIGGLKAKVNTEQVGRKINIYAYYLVESVHLSLHVRCKGEPASETKITIFKKNNPKIGLFFLLYVLGSSKRTKIFYSACINDGAFLRVQTYARAKHASKIIEPKMNGEDILQSRSIPAKAGPIILPKLI